MKYEELKTHVFDMFYDVLEKSDVDFYEKGLMMELEHCMRDSYWDDEEEVNSENWHEKFENEYGYFPDEDDYRMADQVREYKQQYNIR